MQMLIPLVSLVLVNVIPLLVCAMVCARVARMERAKLYLAFAMSATV